MFNFEVLNLEVDYKEAEQKLLELLFKLDHDHSAFTICFGDFSPLFNCNL